MEKKKKKISALPETLEKKLEFPEGSLSDGAYVEIHSDKQVTVRGCKGMLEYAEQTIKINVGQQVLSISGERLRLVTYTLEETVICGKIRTVEFI